MSECRNLLWPAPGMERHPDFMRPAPRYWQLEDGRGKVLDRRRTHHFSEKDRTRVVFYPPFDLPNEYAVVPTQTLRGKAKAWAITALAQFWWQHA